MQVGELAVAPVAAKQEMGGGNRVGNLALAPVGPEMSRSGTAAQAVPVKNGARKWNGKVDTVEWIVQREAGEVLLACSDVASVVSIVDTKVVSTSVTGGMPGRAGYSARGISLIGSDSVRTRTTTATLSALEPSRAVIDLHQSPPDSFFPNLEALAGQWVFDVTPVPGDASLTRVVLTMSGAMSFGFMEEQARAPLPCLLFCCVFCCLPSIRAAQDRFVREFITTTLDRLSNHINLFVPTVGTAPLSVAQEVGTASGVAPTEDRVAALERLAALRDKHVLTQDEFLAEKKRILASP
jgi:hypothetical protein